MGEVLDVIGWCYLILVACVLCAALYGVEAGVAAAVVWTVLLFGLFRGRRPR